MSAYAEGTTVTPERSQAEISASLRKYGASGFMYGWEDARAMIAFKASGKHIRFLLDLPSDAAEYRRTPSGRTRDQRAAEAALEGEIRRRWRALALAIKAKLEAVATGITTFEDEFAMHMVMPDGSTVREHVLPAIEEAYRSGRVIPLLPNHAIEAGR